MKRKPSVLPIHARSPQELTQIGHVTAPSLIVDGATEGVSCCIHFVRRLGTREIRNRGIADPTDRSGICDPDKRNFSNNRTLRHRWLAFEQGALRQRYP